MRRVPFAPFLALAFIACGGDSVAPVYPVEIQIISGDDQIADPGTLLPFPLEVLVLASNGGAMQEARVDWTVTSGGGSLSQKATTTDDLGQSSVKWTLGPTPGLQTVTARAQSVQTPVVFTATANAPLASGSAGFAMPQPSVWRGSK